MSENDPWALVDEDHEGKCWMDDVKAARAAEATQHRQDRRRWAESLKEQHQRHVIESDALRKVLAAWEITANERSARLAAVEAERDAKSRLIAELRRRSEGYEVSPYQRHLCD